MRGKVPAQPDFLTVINLHACVPAEHPLRAIKTRVDAVRQNLSPLFDEFYTAEAAHPPPHQRQRAVGCVTWRTIRCSGCPRV